MKDIPIASLENASLRFGTRTLWKQLNLQILSGEFLAVLGPNGAGKSSLLKALLGLQPLSSGTALVGDKPAQAGSQHIGYIPQQKAFDPGMPIRGVDLVRLGLDGNRWGFGRTKDSRVQGALQLVHATHFANKPLGQLSGGEQQRLRIAQALIGDPKLLLCDEPLLSLDPASQQSISGLIHDQCKRGTSVVFVTHEVNPILDYVDRILYVVGGKWKVGPPKEILTGKVLSELYGAPVSVLEAHGRIIVLSDSLPTEPTEAHHHPSAEDL
ncbi:MAG TPA: ABC transporter ATP-binding protein [Candidatus Saccharimonadales bacterium]|nr:ABC transporter ATP-binding protein [Candidatus Saccharimonadales bacterium]